MRATLEPEDFGEELSNVLEWLADALTLIGPDAVTHVLGEFLSTQDGFRRFASDFLRLASTGIDDLHVDRQEISKEEFDLLLPKNYSLTPVHTEEEGTFVLRIPQGPELILKRSKEGEKYYRLTIKAGNRHETGGQAMLDLNEESDGTKRLLDLLPALYQLRAAGAVYFVDEIDRSMHPMLSYKLLQYFLNVCTDARCQVIVTTHEAGLPARKLKSGSWSPLRCCGSVGAPRSRD